MKRIAMGILAVGFLFLADGEIHAQAETTLADRESVVLYPAIAVTVNKSVVIRLPKKATRVVVTQPQIAEVVVVAPDQLLINGKSVGATSLVVWTEEPTARKK